MKFASPSGVSSGSHVVWARIEALNRIVVVLIQWKCDIQSVSAMNILHVYTWLFSEQHDHEVIFAYISRKICDYIDIILWKCHFQRLIQNR